MQIGQLYRQVRDRFRAKGLSTPDLDAKLLVCAALQISVSELVFKERDPVSSAPAAKAQSYADQRLSGMPVGRILGEREFYGRTFRLNTATLEPRPDTETLVDAVLERSDADWSGLMCDVGTGSGAIAVTLLAEMPGVRMVAVDLSEEALKCAAGNAELHQVQDRFLPVCADYLSAVRPGFDWIVSNPPYIRTAVLDELSAEVIQYDPMLALDGGEDGLNGYGQIVTDAKKLLRTGGMIAMEIGYDQAADLKKQLRHHGFGKIEILRDLSGHDRVAVAEKI